MSIESWMFIPGTLDWSAPGLVTFLGKLEDFTHLKSSATWEWFPYSKNPDSQGSGERASAVMKFTQDLWRSQVATLLGNQTTFFLPADPNQTQPN